MVPVPVPYYNMKILIRNFVKLTKLYQLSMPGSSNPVSHPDLVRIPFQSEPNITRRKVADPVDTLISGTVFPENYVGVVQPVTALVHTVLDLGPILP